MGQNDNTTSLRSIVTRLLIPGKINVVRITGQAGAGKTNHVTPLVKQIAHEQGFWTGELPLDTFFKLSSEDRARWLAEGEQISPDEGARRRDQLTWWDFNLAHKTISTIKDGKPVHLNGIYNRADQGRLTGRLSLQPAGEGLLIFEGVALPHIPGEGLNLYVHAPKHVRFPRLLERDKHRGPEEAQRRFKLTEEFEKRYFADHWHLIHHCIDNSNGQYNDGDLPELPKPETYDMD